MGQRVIKIILRNGYQLLIAVLISAQAHLAWLFGEVFFRLTGRRQFPGSAREEVQTVLVVRLDEIGDMVMTTPFLRELRRLLPHAHITLVVKPGVQNLFEPCPYVNQTIAFNFNYQMPSALRPFILPLRSLRFAVRHLWGRRYDLALLPRWDTDYYYATFIAFWSGAPLRLGFTEKVTAKKRWANRGFDRLLTLALPDQAKRHETERPLLLLHTFGASGGDDRQELWIGESDREAASSLLHQMGVAEGQMLIGIGPAGGHSALKQWPLERFARLGQWLEETYGARLALFGGPDEIELGQQLADQIGPAAINFIGRTSLRQTAALMALCRLYVGNDSGPTHIAAAVGVPVVAIFGSSCPHRFHPGENTTLVWHELPCSPCRTMSHEERCHVCIFDEPRCLTGIMVEEVQQAVAERLSAPARRLILTEGSH